MISDRIELLAKRTSWAIAAIWSRLISAWISRKPNVRLDGSVFITGMPIIDIRKDASLLLGDKVTLNSRNRGYHLNMYSPVKLFADRPGAIIKIGNRSRIHGSCIHAIRLIEIGQNCLVAANCQIFDSNGHDLSFPDVENRINTNGTGKPVVIEDSVWIGANCIILPGVRIGRGSIVSANSVVAGDIPPMVIAGGNPAIVLRTFEDPPSSK